MPLVLLCSGLFISLFAHKRIMIKIKSFNDFIFIIILWLCPVVVNETFSTTPVTIQRGAASNWLEHLVLAQKVGFGYQWDF